MSLASTEPMAKDDEKGPDEHTRVGVTPPKLPGAAPRPPAAPPAAPAPDEHTQLGAKPPPQIGPRPPAAPPPDGGESTRVASTPPPIPKAPTAPPPAAAPVAPPATETTPPPLPQGGGDFGESTIFLGDPQKLAVSVARLQRMQPPGRSDVITLERTHYLMGRLPSCDLRLYSQTASREHAQLSAREGRWYLTPVAGKVVLVNGTQVKEEVPLTHKMRLQLGGDELLFLDDSAPAATAAARPSDVTAVRTADADSQRLLYLVSALVLAVLVLLWMAL